MNMGIYDTWKNQRIRGINNRAIVLRMEILPKRDNASLGYCDISSETPARIYTKAVPNKQLHM
jgi:hypothetical protein